MTDLQQNTTDCPSIRQRAIPNVDLRKSSKDAALVAVSLYAAHNDGRAVLPHVAQYYINQDADLRAQYWDSLLYQAERRLFDSASPVSRRACLLDVRALLLARSFWCVL